MRYLPDLLLGILADSRWRSVAGMDHLFPRRAAAATPTSGNSMRRATWCGPGTPANSTTSGRNSNFRMRWSAMTNARFRLSVRRIRRCSSFPFRCCRIEAAYLAFLAVNLVLLALAFWILRPHMRNLARIWRGLPVFVFLVFYPIALALMQGQDSILLLVLLAAALVALERGQEL